MRTVQAIDLKEGNLRAVLEASLRFREAIPIERIIIFGSKALMLFPGICFGWQGRVVGVSDGDTITVLHDGKGEKIWWSLPNPTPPWDYRKKPGS